MQKSFSGRGVASDLRSLIMPPYSRCPRCNHNELGLMHHLGFKKCKNCMFIEIFKLPALDKKVIYIDQFAISRMMDSIRKSSRNYEKEKDGNFRILFEKLDRLFKLQLAVCLKSNIHKEESLVASVIYKDLKKLYSYLSGSNDFNFPEEIRVRQLGRAYERWCGRSLNIIEMSDALNVGDVNSWVEKIGISVDIVPPDMADEVLNRKSRLSSGFDNCYSIWEKIDKFDYVEKYMEEINAYGALILRRFNDRKKEYKSLEILDINVDELALSMPEMRDLRAVVEIEIFNGLSRKDAVEKAYAFMDSDSIKEMPFLQIWAMLVASLAREASDGRKSRPSKGAFNDFLMIASYLPYCDAIFVDRECHALLNKVPRRTIAGEARENLKIDKKVFSLSNFPAFISYLEGIEKSASQEHINLAREIYGDDFIDQPNLIYGA